MKMVSSKMVLFFGLLTLLAAGGAGAQPDAEKDPSEPDRTVQNGGALFEKNDKRADALKRAETLGFQFLGERIPQHGIKSIDALKVKTVHVNKRAKAHVRVQQTVEGVPVWGGEAAVHLNSDGSLFALTDNLVPNISVDTTPTLTPEAAIELAMDAAVVTYQCGRESSPPPLTQDGTDIVRPPRKEREADLWVMRRDGKDYLVYQIQISCMEGPIPTKPVYFIDAHTGETVWGYDNLQHHSVPSVTGTGISLYSGTVSIATVTDDGYDYYMQDTNLKLGTFYDLTGAGSCQFASDTGNLWDQSSHTRAGVDARAMVDVNYGMEKAYNYYLIVHGRSGLGEVSGGPMLWGSHFGSFTPGCANFGVGYNNAFWDGISTPDHTPSLAFGFGDGDGKPAGFSPLVSLDIVGHEWTHGVTQYSAGLIYASESGALNESMSDVFGAMIERSVRGESSNTWKIGEEVFTPGIAGDALRYMDTPDAGNQPDHYSEVRTCLSGELPSKWNDNCYVHTNSGIPNNAFYLLAQGGTHSRGGSMTGIGADRAAEIWFEALTDPYTLEATDFAGARTATLNAANAIYWVGSAESVAVENAWCLVGVGTCPETDGDLILDTNDLCPGVWNAQYTFTDDPLVVKGTVIKAVHLTELRDAVDGFRAAVGLASTTWSDPTLTAKQTLVKAIHIQELRDRLNEAIAAPQCAGTSLPVYTDPVLTAKSTIIKALHIEELRKSVNGKK
jgi:Zn-dependent metalloprotease